MYNDSTNENNYSFLYNSFPNLDYPKKHMLISKIFIAVPRILSAESMKIFFSLPC